MKKKINNYRFQQQQQAKIRYQELKKVKEIIKEPLKDATEELEYMKKLLSGEDVGNFGPEEPEVVDTISAYWASTNPWLSSYNSAISKLSLSEILELTESPAPIKKKKKININN